MNSEELKEYAKEIADSAIRLDSDVYGNPRYYIPIFMFKGKDGKWFRPFNANKYRGKKYGPGWAFQSYNIRRCVEIAFENEYGKESV